MQADQQARQAAAEAASPAAAQPWQRSGSLPSYHSDASLAARADLEEGEITSREAICPAAVAAEEAAQVSPQAQRPTAASLRPGSAKKHRPVPAMPNAMASPEPIIAPRPVDRNRLSRQEPASGGVNSASRRMSPMHSLQPTPLSSPARHTPAAPVLEGCANGIRPGAAASRALQRRPTARPAAQDRQVSQSGIQGHRQRSGPPRQQAQPQQAGSPLRPVSAPTALHKAAERTLAFQAMPGVDQGLNHGPIPQAAAPVPLAADDPPQLGPGSLPRPIMQPE